MKLSRRLQTVSRFITVNQPVADIGSDHALLPCYLVINRLVPKVIAVEVNEGPYDTAKRQVERYGLERQIDVRLGDGLTVVKPGEVHTVVVAGMGGTLIYRILQQGRDVLEKTQKLVLQPNVAEAKLRRWMLENGWRLVEEELIREQGRYYTIIVAEKGDPYESYRIHSDDGETDFLLEVGPLLWQKKHPLLRAKWEHEIARWETALEQMGQARSGEKRREQFAKKIKRWKERIGCLPKENISSASLNR